jgi:hypothetical protein
MAFPTVHHAAPDGDGPDYSDGIGWGGSWLTRDERAEADAKYLRAMAAINKRARRRELAREIATIKAMQKAGLPVRRAVVDGVTVELGQVEPAATPARGSAAEPRDEWDADLAPLRQ